MEPMIFASIITYIVFAVFFIVGLIYLINPRLMWKIREGWKATKEPPRSFFIFRRIIGFIIMCIPIVWMGFIYYMEHRF